MSTIRYVVSRDAVQFSIDGKPLVIANTHQNYAAIMTGLKAGDIESIKPLLKEVRQAIADSTDGAVQYKDSQLLFEGEVIDSPVLVNRIVSLVKDGVNVQPLVNFIRNLMENPSYRAVQELWGFLEKNKLPLTPDGHFLAYKVIRNDWTDKHSGTMDNSVGKLVKMRRNAVNEDKNQTCSRGLHFCARSYVPSFGSFGGENGDRLVVAKVNPRDVVSIPTDYNGAKGRACQYTIIKELRADEVLPADHVGFDLVDDGKLDETSEPEAPLSIPATDHGDSTPAPVATGVRQTVPGERVYGDDAIANAKALLNAMDSKGEPVHRLSDVARLTGMSRRQVARIRDGEIGAALAAVAPVK